MPIMIQPFQGQLGSILKAELTSGYSEFTIFSAFAKNSGVLRLKEALESFRASGGSIRAFIGVDLDGTSYEALLNLFSLCSELYVVHSENASTTYHNKIYLLEDRKRAWCAVGSNNLTGGGLWTNTEGCSIQTFRLPAEAAELDPIHSIIKKYMDPAYDCSARIRSAEDIDSLYNAEYIQKEAVQKMTAVRKQLTQKEKRKKTPLFGSENVPIPDIISVQRSKKPLARLGQPVDTLLISSAPPAFTNEQFWFEMRRSTGGSRNILDLSKIGAIRHGSVAGTPYEYPEPGKMYGGVKFFEIDPEDTSRQKDITINYCGKDYYPSTIKFAHANGSWRIQLKGAPTDGSDELSKFGKRGDFVNKILLFEKIHTDYYVLSLLDESELGKIRSISRVWARNGNGSASKTYGML